MHAILAWLVTLLLAGPVLAANPQRDVPSMPGLVASKGNEQTLNSLLGLSEFTDTAPGGGYTDYYVSADAGGKAAAGDDTAAGTSWATAWRSLCRADYAIEHESFVRIHFDSDGGNDVWDTLATDLDCAASAEPWGGANWDGSLGPPVYNCGTMDKPCAILLASDPPNRAELDLRNLTENQQQEDCNPNATADLDCHNDNDGLFHGHQRCDDEACSNSAALDSGWLAVSNFHINHYPAMPETTGNIQIKDIAGGNVISLNLKAENILPSDQINFTSVHGGSDIHINPEVSYRDSQDFDSNCTVGSALGCINADTEYPGTRSHPNVATPPDGRCEGANDPWRNCAADGPNFTLQASMPFFHGSGGTSILISNKTYNFINTRDELDTRYGNFSGSNGLGNMFFLGPMVFANAVHTARPEIVGYRTENTLPAPAADTTHEASSGQHVLAFVNFGDATNAAWGDVAATAYLFEQRLNGQPVANQIPTSVRAHQIRAANLSMGLLELSDIEASATLGTQQWEFNCSEVTTFGSEAIQIGTAELDTSAADGLIDIYITDTSLNEGDGNVLQIDADAVAATHAAARTDMDTYAELQCNGDETCATGWVDGNVTAAGVGFTRPVDSLAAPRPGVCSREFSFDFPTGTGVSSNFTEYQKRIRIPAFIGGGEITGFEFNRQ